MFVLNVRIKTENVSFREDILLHIDNNWVNGVLALIKILVIGQKLFCVCYYVSEFKCEQNIKII